MKPISICIIMKNEEKNIEKCLSALAGFGFGKCGKYGEIVVVDTGSTDSSVAIAEKYTDSIYHFEWCNDFAKAKNFAIQKASHDFVMVVDADEYLTRIDYEDLQYFMKQHPDQIGQIKRSNFVLADGIQTIQNDLTERFFHRDYYAFQYPIHEQLLPLKSRSVQYIPIAFHVDHSGYLLSEEQLKEKANRNNELLFQELEKRPEDPYLYFQIGQSYMLMRDQAQALPWFEKGLTFDVDPSLEYVQMMVTGYGSCLLAADRAQDALSLKGVYDAFSQVPEYVFMMGQIYMALSMYMEAFAEFIRCLQLKPGRVPGMTSYFAYHNIGVINEILGNREGAISFYEKAGDYKRSKDRLEELRKLQ
ncbi:MAG: glycosyltransferase [Lachnospiraceae bacterium]